MVVAASREAEGPAGACIPGAVAVPMSMAVRAKRNRRLPAELDRRFEAVVFDWDGTAVPDRSAEAGALRQLVEELCVLGFDLGVVTGTHVGNVDRQLQARPAGPGRLFLCVNRGSEVFRADAMSGLELVRRREATAEEDSALDAAAEATVRTLAARGLSTEVVSPTAQPAQDRPDPRACLVRPAEGSHLRAARGRRGAPAGRRPGRAARGRRAGRAGGAGGRTVGCRG